MWYIHAVEYYPASKRKGILTHAAAWMNIKDSMLSEISQTQKGTFVWFHPYEVLYEVHKVVKFIKTVELWFLGLRPGEWRVIV